MQEKARMKMLGLLGGMSWESTAIYYRHLNELVRERLGGLHSDATANAIKRSACRRPALLATRFTMEQDYYRERLRDLHSIEAVVPVTEERDMVHRVIYEELCCGVVRPESRAAYLEVVDRLRREAGIDGVILGCTEITMLIGPDDLDLPVFDSTRLHCERAVDFALSPASAAAAE
jgi:aspartate racemase